jgi:hypothetical protein
MIGFAQVGVEHLLPAGFHLSSRGRRPDKYGTNLLHKLRTVYLQHPTPWCFGIHAQEAQTARRVLSGFPEMVMSASETWGCSSATLPHFRDAGTIRRVRWRCSANSSLLIMAYAHILTVGQCFLLKEGF